MMIPYVAVMNSPLDPVALRAEAHDPRAGSVVVFEGCARNHHDDKDVELLAYEAFESMAVTELEKLRTEAMERFGLTQCIIHHRIGVVPLCEAAVVVVTASAHRKESFEAVVWIMDIIKERVPIWKRERYTEGGESWVEGEQRH
ncbi:molybdenum cofactor biosynthesis protein MoaE [Holophaga foetida]|uniref:molybdenum cofactor biosynthesis protein MoaE n=1 Tax=Holophaga foetida TaxID=35839 RepID=UPI0002471782|nr:molybdenum cofactor biosynthesis protein MoaE [Holophaga foetida]